jgi:transcriptional regulator with XRE-family HTH domain
MNNLNMTKIEIRLGKKIRQLRQERGYTQIQLAEKVDVSGNYIGYLERGLWQLDKLSHFLSDKLSHASTA